MNKLLLLIVLSFSISFSYAQEKELKGSITNTTGTGGIYIRNQTNPDNAVTHNDGTFKISAAVNDTLLVSSSNYQPEKIVVSEKQYNEAILLITLAEIVNELDEVDLGKTMSKEERELLQKQKDDLKKDLSWEKMEFDYEFTQDKYSAIGGSKAQEAYHNGQQQNDGIKLQVIIPAIINMFKKKQPEDTSTLPEDAVRYFVKQKYTKQELQTYFNIPTRYAEDFLYFIVESGVPDIFLEESNELELTQFINEKALLYNARAKE